jgi:hypothetical protein
VKRVRRPGRMSWRRSRPTCWPGLSTTSYTTTTRAPAGRDIGVLDATGSGKLVGVTASYTGGLSRSYLEGDERIYVDGSGSPAFYGTGTEDFFNGGYYFNQGSYSQPMTGNMAHVAAGSADHTAAYRFFLTDAIGFRRRLVVTLQHGPYDNTTGTSASMLAWYYHRPAAQSSLSDTLNVGNAASERAHRYQVTGQAWHRTSSYTYPGTADAAVITDTGRGYRGHSQFTLAITPGNQGVDLRRRYDQASPARRPASLWTAHSPEPGTSPALTPTTGGETPTSSSRPP